MKRITVLGVLVFVATIALSLGTNSQSASAQSASATCKNGKPGATIIDKSIAWTTAQTYQNGMFCIKDAASNTELSYQTDGNLVWYIKGVAQWSSGTAGTGAWLALQSDGNIGVWKTPTQAVYGAQLNSSTFRSTSPSEYKFLSVGYVGGTINRYQLNHQINLVPGSSQYSSTTSNISHTVSDTGSAANCITDTSFEWDLARNIQPGGLCLVSGANKLIFQADGNLVHYVNGVARWSTGTAGRGAKLAFQADGNIGVYDSSNRAVWGFHATLSQPFRSVDLYYNNGTASMGISNNKIYIQSSSAQTQANNYKVF